MKFKTVFPMLTVAVGLLVSAPAQSVEIRGARSCGDWIKNKEEKNTTLMLASEAWLVGFLSGMAFESNKDVLRGTDNNSIGLWMDNYCKANPLRRISHGAENLFDELARQKRP